MATIPIGKVMATPKGEYSDVRSYGRLDIVSFMGSSYIAKKNTSGNPPTNEAYWQLNARKGDDAPALIIKIYPLIIPNAGWQDGSDEGYFFDVINEHIKEAHHVEVNFDMVSLETTTVCGLSSQFEVLDGKIRFHSENVPETAMSGEYMLIAESGSFIGSSPDLEAYMASEADMEELLSQLNQ